MNKEQIIIISVVLLVSVIFVFITCIWIWWLWRQAGNLGRKCRKKFETKDKEQDND